MSELGAPHGPGALIPDRVTEPFWDGCNSGQLLIQRCRSCGRVQFYPRPHCRNCGALEPEWIEATGSGTLHTYSVVHRGAPGFEQDAPYIAAIVDLDEGVRMVGNLVEIDPNDVRVGMALRVVFRERSDRFVPFWTSASC